ncbi:MAG TPA: rhodanese-like domain-containing protein [Ramlibacter sp.]|nr:rhodanese-like domain-containing protein [Ramlibacter sp.]
MTTIDQIRPAQLAAWFQAQGATGEPVVLDVREDWELQAASVRADGFKLVKIPMGDVPGHLGEFDPQQPLAILCHHGNRSQRVALFLAAQGFAKLANVAGGIEAWSGEVDDSVPRY